MKKYELIDRKPIAEEMTSLRKSVGWGISDIDSMKKGLENSLFGICAIAEDKVIGSARVVGDGFTAFYIQDVIVDPEFQRIGIRMAMMNRIMSYISEHACTGAVVGLMSAEGKEEFYERFGFKKRPNENFGAGMTQFWK